MDNAQPAHTTEDAGLNVRRGTLLQSARRVAMPLPDAVLAVLFAFVAISPYLPVPTYIPLPFFTLQDDLIFGLFVEGGFLMLQASLTDLATRLRKRPPIWSIPLVVGALVVFTPYSLGVVRMAWGRGWLVLLPLLISLLERATLLWTMPVQSRERKIAVRALVSNRINTALGLCGLATAAMLVFVFLGREVPESTLFATAGSLYFAVAAFDAWRVRGRAFAKNPRVLFRYDYLGVKSLEPI